MYTILRAIEWPTVLIAVAIYGGFWDSDLVFSRLAGMACHASRCVFCSLAQFIAA